MNPNIPLLILFYIIAISCTQKTKQQETTQKAASNTSYDLPFNLELSSHTLEMEKKLDEISGLTHDNDDNLWCINDEKGNLYELGANGKVKTKIDFGKSGDYESLAYHDGLIYASESNGNIKVVDIKKKEKVGEYNMRFNRKVNIEGLYYSKEENALLVARKSENQNGETQIYLFDLENDKVEDNVKFTFDLNEALKSLIESKILDASMDNSKVKSRIKAFAPSGISQDPFTQKYYITSSRGRLLTILDKQGKVEYIHLLDEELFRQPEGISFDSKGHLYISNEARGQVANVRIFKRK